MDRQHPGAPFNELYLFIHVVQAGGLTAAAERLGISKSAISQRLAQLERQLGLRLLNRTTRSIAPTAAGEQLYRQTAPLFAGIQAEVRALGDFCGQPSGTVRINASQVAIDCVLLPKLQPLLAAHPRINVELQTDNRWADIVGEGFDMGVRLGGTIGKEMIAVQISPPMKMALVASPAYLQDRPTPRSLDDLPQHRTIAVRLSSQHGALIAWEFKRQGQTVAWTPPAQIIVSHSHRKAALCHHGIAWLPHMMVADDLARGDLVELLPELAHSYDPLYLYYPSRKGNSSVFKLVVNALRHKASAAPAPQA